MKYILSTDKSEPGIWYERYLSYLETIRSSLPEHVYAFASADKYFTLQSPHSLHDSWLESVEVHESHADDESTVEITLKFFGQAHDRLIILNYERVADYVLKGNRRVSEAPVGFGYNDTFHGDVITHEIRLSEVGNIIHEIAFAADSTLLIECRNFVHREEMLPTERKI